MSTVTIPRPDVSTEDVAAALRKGLGPRHQVKPGMRTSLLPGAPDPGWSGASSPPSAAGALAGGLYPRQARTACTSSPARLSARSCRMWLTT